MKIKKTFSAFLTAVFVLGTMAMNAQTQVYTYKTDGTTAYNISTVDSISFTSPTGSSDPTSIYVYKTDGSVEMQKISDVDSISFKAPVTTIFVTGVTVNPTTADLIVGDTQQLSATVAPSNADDRSVTWSSDDEDVAYVDQTGMVMAIGEGTATITVTTNDGKKTATCAVTVSPMSSEMENITDDYLQNPRAPFATTGAAVSPTGRYLLASGWLVNDATAVAGDVDNLMGFRLGFVAGKGTDWDASVEEVDDGHIYQTINLPAGNYRFDGMLYDTAGYDKFGGILDAYVVVLIGGGDLPSIDDIKSGNTTASVLLIPEKTSDLVSKLSINFKLSSAGPVSVGFVANNPGYSRIFFTSVALWKL